MGIVRLSAPGLGRAYQRDPKIVRAYVKRLRGKLGDDAESPVDTLRTVPRRRTHLPLEQCR